MRYIGYATDGTERRELPMTTWGGTTQGVIDAYQKIVDSLGTNWHLERINTRPDYAHLSPRTIYPSER
jgi:hypothetical protein